MIHEIRESINLDNITYTNGLAFVERVIELKRGYKHTINAIDVFVDNLFMDTDEAPGLLEVVLSSQPILMTREVFNSLYEESTPMVSNDHILYKMQFEVSNRDTTPGRILQEFPNNFLGAMPTFSWYTPKIYMYCVFYNVPQALRVNNARVSAYVAVNNKKVAYLPYMLGNIRERSIAMSARIMSMGRLMAPARITGQTFPMYLYGGARTQFMMNSNALAEFWYQLDPQSSESMLTTTEQRQFVAASRTMVPFDSAFGEENVALGGVPDWVRLFALPGIVSGPVRDQWPPAKKFDNGNVMML